MRKNFILFKMEEMSRDELIEIVKKIQAEKALQEERINFLENKVKELELTVYFLQIFHFKCIISLTNQKEELIKGNKGLNNECEKYVTLI